MLEHPNHEFMDLNGLADWTSVCVCVSLLRRSIAIRDNPAKVLLVLLVREVNPLPLCVGQDSIDACSVGLVEGEHSEDHHPPSPHPADQ